VADPAGLLVVGVEERATPELRVRVAELARELERHVPAVGKTEEMEPGLDAVQDEPAVEILEVRARSGRAGDWGLAVRGRNDEASAGERGDAAVPHRDAVLVRAAKREHDRAGFREDVERRRPIDEKPPAVDGLEDGSRRIRLELLLRLRVE